jgi:hypothetical protein
LLSDLTGCEKIKGEAERRIFVGLVFVKGGKAGFEVGMKGVDARIE